MRKVVFLGALLAAVGGFAEITVQNADFERGNGADLAGWQTSSTNFAIVAGAGLNGNHGLVWHRAEKGGHELVSQAVTGWKVGERYTVTVKARTQNFTSLNWWGACVGLEVQDKDGKYISASYGRFSGKDKPFTKLVATMKNPIPENAARLVVQLFVGGSGHKNLSGTVTWDEVSVTRIEVKPVLFMHSSAYRDEATEGKVRFGVALEVPLDQKGKVTGAFTWRDAEGKVRKTAPSTLTDAEAIAELDVGTFTYGTTKVVFRLYAADGKTLGETSLDFRRPRTKTPRHVEIDACDRCLVDGQPFFPLGLYFGQPTKAELDVYRQGPFNCLMPYACVSSNDLNRVHAAGLKTFVSFQNILKNTKNGIKYGYTTDEKVNAFYVNRVRRFKNHPAVLGWYLFDEPADGILAELKRVYGLIRAEDPDHPIWGVHHIVDEVRMRVPLCDVIGVDPYPVSTTYPLRQVADFAQATQTAQFGSGPMWNVPQAIDWAWYHKDLPVTRFPTEAELKSMLWQNIVRGAKGLIGYAFHSMRKHENFEANWRTTCAAFGEVASVTNILLSVERAPVVRSSERDVAVRAWAKGGCAYVLACNLSEKPVAVRVTVADGSWRIAGTPVGTPGLMADAQTLALNLPAIGCSMTKLSAVGSAAPAGTGICVVNPDFERGCGADIPGWQTSSTNFAIVAGAGLNGNHGLVWHRAEKGGPETISQDLAGWKVGERYAVTAKARTENFTSANWWGANVGLVVLDKNDRWLDAAYTHVHGANTPYEKKTATTKPLPEGAARLVLRVTVGGHGHTNVCGTVSWDDISVTHVEEKPVGFMRSSAYRNEATDGKVRFGVALEVPYAHKGKVTGAFTWRDAGGNVQQLAPSSLTDAAAIVDLDVGTFACGTTKVGFRLYAADGKTLGETSLDFTRPRMKTPRHVEFDTYNRCLVDGQPFFPLGLYFRHATPQAALDVYRQGPFNCLMPYGKMQCNDLDRVQAAGLKTFIAFQGVLKSSKNGIKYGYTTDEKVNDFYLNRVRLFKDHPAVLGWYLFDEPADAILPELSRLYGLISRADPDHPVWGVHHIIDEVRPRVPLCDVIGMDPYPVSTRYPLRQVADFAQATQAAQFGSGPMWNVVQVFDWGSVRKDLPVTRFPTEAEMKSMVWQNIVRGAKGLVGYSFFSMREGKDFDANWRTTCAAFGEVASVTNILLSVERAPLVRSSEKDVAVRAWAKDGCAYVLACNLGEKPVAVRVTVAGGSWRIAGTPVGTPGLMADAQTLALDLPAIGYSMSRLVPCARNQ